MPPATSGLLPAAQVTATNPHAAWLEWIQPVFAASDGTTAAYFTGTYSDDYGFPNGLTLPRNVHKDVRRYLKEVRLDDARFICGVESHRYRDILHWHGIIAGQFTDHDLTFLKRWWSAERGHARVLPVHDGCSSYVTKYALKGDTENFDWRLS